MLVQVTYQCWGCGAEETREEDIEGEVIDFEEITRGNLCEECTNRTEPRKEGG